MQEKLRLLIVVDITASHDAPNGTLERHRDHILCMIENISWRCKLTDWERGTSGTSSGLMPLNDVNPKLYS